MLRRRLEACPSSVSTGRSGMVSRSMSWFGPEDFAVVADPRGQGIVRSREFRGDSTLLIVAIPSGGTLKCRQRSDTALAAGTRVALRFEKDGAFVAFERGDTGP